MITAGPTREPLDPVRFLSNASSGRMGIELARAALRRGARVCLVLGPVERPVPRGLELIRVESALEMRSAVLRRCSASDVVIAAAAVSDWRLPRPSSRKIKRKPGVFRLTLIPNPDIIKEVARRRAAEGSRQILVGFALETERSEERARAKLVNKGLDLIVVNGPDALDRRESRAAIGKKSGEFVRLKRQDKRETARAVLGCIEEIWKAPRNKVSES